MKIHATASQNNFSCAVQSSDRLPADLDSSRDDRDLSVTTATVSSRSSAAPAVSIAEIVLGVLLVCAWITSLIMFLRKWRRLRMVLPPVDGFRCHSPKNLDAVTVIGRQNDSIIYPVYSPQITSTMRVWHNNDKKIPLLLELSEALRTSSVTMPTGSSV